MNAQHAASSTRQSRSDELASLRHELTLIHSRLDRLQYRRTRGRLRHIPLFAIVAFLIALTPLSIFAANLFTDLDPAQSGPTGHNANIDLIYDAGITKGCGGDATTYCP